MELQHVTFGYRKHKPVLQDVSFTLKPGITVLLGENGSGKTTLIKNMLGLLQPDSGNISIPQSGVRYLPQEFSVYPSLRVQDILRFVAEETGVERSQRDDCVRSAAQKANVLDFLNRRFSACSIGTQKRVGIAATLIGSPRLAVLDEPTAGVDPKERMAFYQVVQEAFEGVSVLLSTHILDDLESLADSVLMLSKGKIVFAGTYQEYRSVLQGRLYAFSAPQRPAWLARYPVVSAHRVNGVQTWHFVSEQTPPDGDPISATTEDIWTYLTGGSV
ncbi:MAG: ABC transporter ATP-binding protein [Faecousia sp.]